MKSTAITLLNTFSEYAKITGADTTAIEKIFTNPTAIDFDIASQEMYQWFETNPKFEALTSYMADLLVLSYLLEGMRTHGEGYLDSPEWAHIEDMSSDDGTEWLNFFVYIADCKVNEIDPEIEDYLYNFLLVEEDDQQMEFEIYESLIEMQEMVGYETPDILKACASVGEANMLESLLPVFLLFFSGEKHFVPGMDPEVAALLKATHVCVEEIGALA
jgi:hypothetical protein